MRIYRRNGKVAERPHLNLPAGTYEEELGLEGFYGPVAHLYHKHAPTDWSNLSRASFQWAPRESKPTEFLRPQCYKHAADTISGNLFTSSRLLFWNEEIAIHLHRVTEQTPIYFRNADASELYFVHEGTATLDSIFGEVAVERGDYVVIPKGVTYRWKTNSAFLLRIESFQSWFKKPETGILGQQALYHEEGIHAPVFHSERNEDKSSTIWVQTNGELSQIDYPFDIRNLSGWMGTLYPYKLSIKNIAPVLSSIAHLPPSINSTFMGHRFIVCTFLPRPLEEPEGALKVPFFHSNIDYDEFIFYHDGDFFSRDNMRAGCMTLHPRGINHGPHPKALVGQGKKSRTDEIAVMIDTERPLNRSTFAQSLEQPTYWRSWMRSL